MKEQLEQRLKELKTEFENGQKMLAYMEARQANLRNTLIRISGAVQVLEELLNQKPPAEEQMSGKTEEPEIQRVASV